MAERDFNVLNDRECFASIFVVYSSWLVEVLLTELSALKVLINR